MIWLRTDGEDLLLSLHIQPGAKTTNVVGLHGEALKIRLAAPPVGGRANACLIAFIAERLGVPKSRIELVGGETSRTKRLRVVGVGAALAVERLHVKAPS